VLLVLAASCASGSWLSLRNQPPLYPARRPPARRRRCGPPACAAWRWPRPRPPAGRCSPPARCTRPSMHVRPMLGAVWGTAALSAGGEGNRAGLGWQYTGGWLMRCIRGAGGAAAPSGLPNKVQSAGPRLAGLRVLTLGGFIRPAVCCRGSAASGAQTPCMHAVCPAPPPYLPKAILTGQGIAYHIPTYPNPASPSAMRPGPRRARLVQL